MLLHQYGVDRDESGRSLSCVLIQNSADRLLKLWLKPEHAASSMMTDWLSETAPYSMMTDWLSETEQPEPTPFDFGATSVALVPVLVSAPAPSAAAVPAPSVHPVCRLLHAAKQNVSVFNPVSPFAVRPQAHQSPASSVLRTLETATQWWAAAVLPQMQSELDAHLLPELRSIVLSYLTPESLLKPPVLPEPPASVLSTRRLLAQLSPLTDSSLLAADVHDQLRVILVQASKEETDRWNASKAAEAAAELQN